MSNKKEIIIKATKLKKSFITGDTEQTIFENLDLNIYKSDFTVIKLFLSLVALIIISFLLLIAIPPSVF